MAHSTMLHVRVNDEINQIPLAQTVVRVGYGGLLSVGWNTGGIRVLPNFAKEPTLAP